MTSLIINASNSLLKCLQTFFRFIQSKGCGYYHDDKHTQWKNGTVLRSIIPSHPWPNIWTVLGRRWTYSWTSERTSFCLNSRQAKPIRVNSAGQGSANLQPMTTAAATATTAAAASIPPRGDGEARPHSWSWSRLLTSPSLPSYSHKHARARSLRLKGRLVRSPLPEKRGRRESRKSKYTESGKGQKAEQCQALGLLAARRVVQSAKCVSRPN